MHSIIARSLAAVLLLACFHPGVAQEGALDMTFNPGDLGSALGDGANDRVHAMCVQPDGKIIIAGDFTRYNGASRYRVARVNPDGSLDPSFVPTQGAVGPIYWNVVRSVILQPDGKVIIGGSFTSYNGTSRNRIARLQANGSLDTSFDPGSGADDEVLSTALQSDGKIIICGYFTSYNGTSCGHIARLNTDGSRDTSFDPGTGANDNVVGSFLQPDGKILLGGWFTSFNGTARNYIARLNANGSLDASFDPGSGASTTVSCFNLQADGKVLIGGYFTNYNGTGRNRIARLNNDGSLDLTFNPGTGADWEVNTISRQSDGKVLIGGYFHNYNGTPRERIARLNNDGSLDASFNPGSGAAGQVLSSVVRPDGKIILGGVFKSFNATSRNRICRLNTDGSLDGSFDPPMAANDMVNAIAVQPDGKVLIGGDFSGYNGAVRSCIARANPDGSADASFTPGGAGTGGTTHLYSITLQPDGKIILGGNFTVFNFTEHRRITRINADGSSDASFNPGTGASNYEVFTTALQPNGKIIIGGTFDSFNGTLRNRIARLNSNGSLDATFNPGTGANSSVSSTVVQPDGKILIGGSFTTFNGTARNYIARLNSDGSLDTSFDPGTGASYLVNAITLQPDGKVLIGGWFTSYNGTPREGIARLNANGSLDTSFDPGTGANGSVTSIIAQGDGKILICGSFLTYNGVPRKCIARLHANGTLDTSLDPGTGASGLTGQWIECVAMQPDGKLLIGGLFTSYNGIGRNRIARLTGTPRASIKVMLEGPYNGSTMSDALRILPAFPLTEPFTAMGYAETGYTGGATIGSSVLSTTGNNAIVDWVIVEMRPVATPGTVAAARAVLLQRDGDVVDLDGVSTVGFAGLAAGNYCVAVKPRNHLPVMLSVTTPVSYGAANATVDFTLPTTQVYDNDARKNVSGVMVLAAGDVSFNETVQYTGSGNDRDPILTRVGSTTPNNSVSGYWREDVNMDGVVKYTGSANDRDIILTTVGSTTPNNMRVATLP